MYKVGDKVKVINCIHGAEIDNGEIVTIVQVGNEDDGPNAYGFISPHDGALWWLYDDEIEPYCGCEYCQNHKHLSYIDENNNVVINDENQLVVMVGGGTVTANIPYCPMCGRKL